MLVSSLFLYCHLVSFLSQNHMISAAYRFRPRVVNLYDFSLFLTSDEDVDRYTRFIITASCNPKNTFAIVHTDDKDNLSLLCVEGNVVKSTLSNLKRKEFIYMLDDCLRWYREIRNDTIRIDCKFALDTILNS
jgi:hypothetical protein